MQDNPVIRLLLFPFSLLYGLIVFIRNRMFDSGILPETEFNIPVISIGNITAGGTGKTPVTEYIAELLMNDYRVAVLSRGYNRKSKGFVLLSVNSSPLEAGDEPCQIKNHYPELVVAVCENRVRGIKKIISVYPETDVILLDDAFQHRYVKPGLSILLIDYNRPVTKDFLLPAGRLREPASESKRASIVLVTKSPERLKPIEKRIMVMELAIPSYQNLFFTSIAYGELMPVFEEYNKADIEELKEEKPEMLLVTGIQNPRPLKRFARSISTKISELTFPDRYNFTEKDILKIQNSFFSLMEGKRIILTTWKDAVRLRLFKNIPEEIKKVFFFVPIKINFQDDDHIPFSKLIVNYVSNNKRNSVLYKEKNRI
jgi:tetraacyldisaccharide 4'-kinase